MRSPKKVVQTTSTFPKSVSLSTLLQLGKVIHPKCNEIIELYLEEFSIDKREWLLPFSVKVSVNSSPFASGGFRNAFEAQAISGLEGKYVLKRYIPDQVKAIEEMFGSLDIHTRKSVQMHSLAKYYASIMEKESSAHKEFGESFRYWGFFCLHQIFTYSFCCSCFFTIVDYSSFTGFSCLLFHSHPTL